MNTSRSILPEGQQKILVVEDEPAIADNIRYALETEGFDVVWCRIGADALDALAENTIQLIVLDVGLPDISGFDLCKTIRKSSTIPIIFLTARSDEIDRVVGLEIGADDYVTKPFSPRELSARVKAILRRSQPANVQPEHTGSDSPFRLDAEKMKVFYYDAPLELSRYEFRIIELLIHRPGRVYSREQLMDLVWEAPEFSMDRTVDTHVKTLRAKLREINPDVDPIVTHRGLGYALKETW